MNSAVQVQCSAKKAWTAVWRMWSQECPGGASHPAASLTHSVNCGVKSMCEVGAARWVTRGSGQRCGSGAPLQNDH